MAFARYKGEAEKAPLAAGFPRVYIFRPAYIYPVEPRKEPNFSYRLLRVIYPAFRVLFPNQVIPPDDLARASYWSEPRCDFKPLIPLPAAWER